MVFDKDEVKKGRTPDYSSNEGIAIWENTDKNGKMYLSVKIPLLNISTNCFKVERKTEKENE